MQVDALEIPESTLDKIERKHGVTFDEVQEMLFAGQPAIRRGHDGRYYFFGQTEAGRYLWAVLAPKDGDPGTWTVITARDMSDSERRSYRR